MLPFLLLFVAETGFARSDDAGLTAGRLAVSDGQFRDAQRYLKRAIRKAGDAEVRNQARVLLAQALCGLDEVDQALELLETSPDELSSDEVRAGFFYWQGFALLKLGERVKAVEQLKKISSLEQSVWTGPGHFLRLRILMDEENVDAALAQMAEFDRQFGESDWAAPNLLKWGALLAENQQLGGAEKRFTDLLEKHSGTIEAARARLLLAQLKADEQLVPEAIALLQDGLKQEALDQGMRREMLETLAVFLDQEARYDDARNALVEALESTDVEEQAAEIEARIALLDARNADPDVAIEAIHKALDQIQDREQAGAFQLHLGDQLLEQKDFTRARAEFQRYLEQFTDPAGRARAAQGKAWSLMGQKKYLEAAGMFSQAIGLLDGQPEREEAMIKLGDAWFAHPDFEQAARAYEAVVVEFPDSSRNTHVRFQWAESLARSGHVEEALLLLDDMEKDAQKKGQSLMAALRRAELLEREGRREEAVQVYSSVLETYGDMAAGRALLGRGRVLYHLGRFYEALSDFEEVGGRYPESEYAEQAMALSVWCLYLLGRDTEAVELASDFILRYPESMLSPQIRFWQAEYRYNRKEYEAAQNLFGKLAEDYPDHDLADDALFWAGRSAFEQELYLQAIARNKELIERYPESPKRPEARFAQGDSLSKLGEFSGAILAFEEIVRRYPDHYLADEAQGRIGDCHFTLGSQDPVRYRESLDAYLKILNQSQEDTEMVLQARYKAGRCYDKMQEVDQALSFYLDGVYGYLDDVANGGTPSPVWFARSAFAAADLLLAREDWEGAANLYRRVAQAGVPASEDARQRLQKLRLEHWRLF